MRHIYLDHNATTPVLPEVLEALQPFVSEYFGNPSSLHQAGADAARQIRRARREVASWLGAVDEREIIFTSGGTESNNTVLRSALFTSKGKRHIVTTAVEHSSILKLTQALAEEGVETVYCPVNRTGMLDPEEFSRALTEEVALVSVMMANNETGVLFPVDELAEEAHSKGILFHTDAVQCAGKIPISLKDSAIDFLSLSAHKFGGPKGVGALYVRREVPFRPFCFGGAQERGRRAGTENVAGIVGLARAAKWHEDSGETAMERIRALRDFFEEEVIRLVPNVEINGDLVRRLPNTSNLAFEGVDAEALLILLDQEGVCASSGSACLSGSPEPSHVLKAMGFSDERARSSVRFSFGIPSTAEEMGQAVDLLGRLVRNLREIDFKEQHPHSVLN